MRYSPKKELNLNVKEKLFKQCLSLHAMDGNMLQNHDCHFDVVFAS